MSTSFMLGKYNMLVERQDRKIKLITGLSIFLSPLTERVAWLVFIVASGL
jgi:hypothetical protein